MKLLESRKTLRVITIIAIIFGPLTSVLYGIYSGHVTVQNLIYLLQGVFPFMIYKAVLKEHKHVFKVLVSSLLMMLVLNELNYVFSGFPERYALAADAGVVISVLFLEVETVFFVCVMMDYINYIRLGFNHEHSHRIMELNKWLLYSIVVIVFLQTLFNLMTLKEAAPLNVITQVTWLLMEIGTYGTIICIESEIHILE